MTLTNRVLQTDTGSLFDTFGRIYEKKWLACLIKVQTFWETHKIWKNLPYGFDKSADLLSKRQNHKADFFKLCVLFKKSELEMKKIYFDNINLSKNAKSNEYNLFLFHE